MHVPDDDGTSTWEAVKYTLHASSIFRRFLNVLLLSSTTTINILNLALVQIIRQNKNVCSRRKITLTPLHKIFLVLFVVWIKEEEWCLYYDEDDKDIFCHSCFFNVCCRRHHQPAVELEPLVDEREVMGSEAIVVNTTCWFSCVTA